MPVVDLEFNGEAISEYICDYPDCPNVATQWYFAREYGTFMYCDADHSKRAEDEKVQKPSE